MNCPKCSGQVDPTHRFCNWCGVALTGDAPVATADAVETSEPVQDESPTGVDSAATSTPVPPSPPPPVSPPPPPPPSSSSPPPPPPPALEPLQLPLLLAPGEQDPALADWAPEPAAVDHAPEAAGIRDEIDLPAAAPSDAAPVAQPTVSPIAPPDMSTPGEVAPSDTAPEGTTSNDTTSEPAADIPAPVEDTQVALFAPVIEPEAVGLNDLEWAPLSALSAAEHDDDVVFAAPVSETPVPDAPVPDAPVLDAPGDPHTPSSFGAPLGQPSPDQQPSPDLPSEPSRRSHRARSTKKSTHQPDQPDQQADIAEALPATTVVPTAAASDNGVQRRFRPTPFAVVALIGAVVSVVSMFVNLVSVTSDVPIDIAPDNPYGFKVGQWTAGDLAGNLPIAGIIVAAGMLIGAIVAGTGRRWGAGLAGGSGAAAVGIAALTLGVAQFPIDAAQRLVAVPSEQQFVLAITRDVGYWLQVAVAALGVTVLWLSTSDARADRRRSLNPWIAALGALATLVASLGPLLPVNQALFSDNWFLIDAITAPSQLLMIGRLIQLVIFAAAGIIGFLLVNRYGLGLVFGSTLPIVWLTVTAALNVTNHPVGFAFANPGATTMEVQSVTIVGVAATLAMGLIACAAALEQNLRQR